MPHLAVGSNWNWLWNKAVISKKGGRTQAVEGNFVFSGHFSANRNERLEANCARNKFPTRSDLQGIAGAPRLGAGCFLGRSGIAARTANAHVLEEVTEASKGSREFLLLLVDPITRGETVSFAFPFYLVPVDSKMENSTK